MARTSKRGSRLESQALSEQKTYVAGIYARLSVDHHDGKEVSIETQIEMGKTFLESHKEIFLYDCYSDLGATGTNFWRSDFERLMQDVREGKINCVIVKDFSRFGRNYVETGNFVEKIFPFMGVRFIAITDQYDSVKQVDCNEALSMHLKNIANELYARDISEKVTASKQTKRKQGEYLGSVPPYGFRIEKMDGRRTLVREPLTSEIVREIFERYVSGETVVSIVKWLYEQKIHCPGDYKKYKTVYQRDGQKLRQWRREAIRCLLSNAAYVGNLVQSGKQMKEPITAEHSYEPLVPEEVFCRVWERLEENRKIQKSRSLRKDTMEDIFREVLYCGECGQKYSRTVTERKASDNEMRIFISYGCPNRKRIDEEKCKNEPVTFLHLQKVVLSLLKKEFLLGGAQMKKLTDFNKEAGEKRKEQIEKAQKELRKSAENTDRKISFCYLEYRRGIVSQTQFLEIKKKLEEKKEQNQQILRELHLKYTSVDRLVHRQNQALRTILKYQSGAELNAELVQNLIEKIYVYPGKRIEIIWKWKDTLTELKMMDISCPEDRKVEEKNSKKFVKVSGGTSDAKQAEDRNVSAII